MKKIRVALSEISGTGVFAGEDIQKGEVILAQVDSLPLHFVYILECADGSLYVGATNNLEKRLNEHNHAKRGAHYTKIRRPVTLKYSESFSTLADARKREAELKGWRREKKMALINKNESA